MPQLPLALSGEHDESTNGPQLPVWRAERATPGDRDSASTPVRRSSTAARSYLRPPVTSITTQTDRQTDRPGTLTTRA